MKRTIISMLLCACFAGAQTASALTSDTISELVQVGVHAAPFLTPVATQSASQPVPTPAAPSASSRFLGRPEIRGFVGANGSTDRYPFPGVSYTLGAEVAVGLLKYLSATGTYAFDNIGTRYGIAAHAHEFMGGARVPFRNRSKVTPYIQTSLGGFNVSGSHTGGFSVGVTKFAVAPGGGMDFRLSRHMGLGFDFRAIKAIDVPYGGLSWQYRTTVGFSYGF
jgi:hypothetical protein